VDEADRNAVTGQTAGDSRGGDGADLRAAAERIFGADGATWTNGHDGPLPTWDPDPEAVVDDDALGPLA
jgi:hypothetical protein